MGNFVEGAPTEEEWVAETQRRREEIFSKELNALSYAIVGAAMEVHRHLGPGFLESVYEDALAIELRLRRLGFERQVRIPVEYKGTLICEHVLDLVVEHQIVVELKASETLHQVHRAQLHSYLKAGRYELGLLINFNVPCLKDGVRRVILRAEGAEKLLSATLRLCDPFTATQCFDDECVDDDD